QRGCQAGATCGITLSVLGALGYFTPRCRVSSQGVATLPGDLLQRRLKLGRSGFHGVAGGLEKTSATAGSERLRGCRGFFERSVFEGTEQELVRLAQVDLSEGVQRREPSGLVARLAVDASQGIEGVLEALAPDLF